MNLRASLAVVVLSAGSLLSTSCRGSCDDCGGFGPNIFVSADTAPPTTLGTQSTFTIKLQSPDFSGPVTLGIAGVPAGWTASVIDTIVTITGGDSAMVPVVITVPSTGPAAAAGQAFTIDATVEGGIHVSTGTRLVVANEYIIHFHPGASTGPHWGALQATGVHLSSGTTFTIQNDDTVGHIIHANIGNIGIPHQSVAGIGMPPGGAYGAVVNQTGADLIACHSHNHSDTLRVTVP